jgi:hypothetical protein
MWLMLLNILAIKNQLRLHKSILYTWSSTYDQLPFWLTGHKSIWSYVGHIFTNIIF